MTNNLLNVFIFLVSAIFITLYMYLVVSSFVNSSYVCSVYRKLVVEPTGDEDRVNFEGFDNESGTKDGRYIVPNYVHFLRFGLKELSFIDAVCILAAFKNQRPEKIFIHGDGKFEGKYWDVVMNVEGLKEILVIEKVDIPTKIFGLELNPNWLKWHASDVTRIRILMKYGGIFLDNDSYVVRSLDDFRRYEMTLGWMEGAGLANQAIVAHKNARFLRLWLDSFRRYNASLWYDNAGNRPTREILEKQPHLIHREKYLLANHHIANELYLIQWAQWKSHYAIHLLYNRQYILTKNVSSRATYPVRFDEFNIAIYPVTIRDMVYDVYPQALLPGTFSRE